MDQWDWCSRPAVSYHGRSASPSQMERLYGLKSSPIAITSSNSICRFLMIEMTRFRRCTVAEALHALVSYAAVNRPPKLAVDTSPPTIRYQSYPIDVDCALI